MKIKNTKGVNAYSTESNSNTANTEPYQHKVVLATPYYLIVHDRNGNNWTIQGQFPGIKSGDYISSEEIGEF